MDERRRRLREVRAELARDQHRREDLMRERDALIVDLDGDYSAMTLARDSGLSPSRVKQLRKRDTH